MDDLTRCARQVSDVLVAGASTNAIDTALCNSQPTPGHHSDNMMSELGCTADFKRLPTPYAQVLPNQPSRSTVTE